MLYIDKKGAKEMGRENFISSMLKHSLFKDMGDVKSNEWLNNYYDALEGTNEDNEQPKAKKSISTTRKRK